MNGWPSSESVRRPDLRASSKVEAVKTYECLDGGVVDTGAQPLVSEDGKLALCVNGEIYNHRALARSLKTPLKAKPKSDCEVILPLVRPLMPAADHPADPVGSPTTTVARTRS